jgi:hypothetical protein
MCHGPRYWAPPEYLDHVTDGFEAVADDDVDAQPIEAFFGANVREASFGDFSIIFTADETGA